MSLTVWSGWIGCLALVPLLGCAAAAEGSTGLPDTLTGVDGSTLKTDDWDGKVLLFVNVASKCGFTSQYDGLEALWKKYEDQGLVVVGVPCNQFGGQEPGTGEEIKSFCRINYGVSFPLLDKQNVNGKNKGELYDFLLKGRTPVLWNFEKVLVGRDGKVIDRFRSKTAPDAEKLVNAIEAALNG